MGFFTTTGSSPFDHIHKTTINSTIREEATAAIYSTLRTTRTTTAAAEQRRRHHYTNTLTHSLAALTLCCSYIEVWDFLFIHFSCVC